MSILLGVTLLFAVLAVALAALQAAAISKVAPESPWRGWLLGWWRFGEITQRAGQAGAQHVSIYKRAVIVALVFIVFGLVLSGWAVNQGNQSVAGLNHTSWTGPQVDMAGLSETSYLRPVATMPGAIIVES